MGEVIHEPVDGRVEVRPGHDGHVQVVRERVVSIQHDEQREGQPARGEHEVNDEESARQLQRGSGTPSTGSGALVWLSHADPLARPVVLVTVVRGLLRASVLSLKSVRSHLCHRTACVESQLLQKVLFPLKVGFLRLDFWLLVIFFVGFLPCKIADGSSVICGFGQLELIEASGRLRGADGGFGFLVGVVTVVVDFQSGLPHVHIQPDVGQTDDGDRNQDHDDCENDGVTVVGHPVPDALQTLVVEGVIPDADEVEGDEDKSQEVEAAAHGDAVPDGEDAAVEMSVTDEDVAVAAHGSQRHQGTHAGDGAEVGNHATQYRNITEEPPAQSLP